MKLAQARKKSVQLLVFLMQTGSKYCPPKNFFPIYSRILLNIAKNNKAIFFLLHFLNCPSCQKYTKPSFLSQLKQYRTHKLTSSLLLEQEKKELLTFLRRQKIKAVLFKDFSSSHRINLYKDYCFGPDIDILIQKTDLSTVTKYYLSKGYKLKKYLPKEVAFFNSFNKIAVDVHILLADHGQPEDFFNAKFIKYFTSFIYRHSYHSKDGFYRLSKDLFLLTIILRYWANDWLNGLRSLLDISEFANFYDKEINWNNFFRTAKAFHLVNFSIFVLLLGNRIFNQPSPSGLNRTPKPRLKYELLLSYYSIFKIALFPSFSKWHQDKLISKEYFFLKFILNETNSFIRLIRPQIILFIFRAGINYIKTQFLSFFIKKNSPFP